MNRHILRPWHHVIYPRRSLAPAPVGRFGIEGIVKRVELVNARTGIIERALTGYPRKNLITDAGLNGIGNGTDLEALINYLGVGTDNTTPAVGQTALGAQVGARYNANGGFADVVSSGPNFAYWEVEITRVVPTTGGNGNLTEFGFFSAGSGGIMWCRQLFLDGGTPTAITKTSEQELRITYAWRVYPQAAEDPDALTIGGVSTTCTSRAMDIDNAAYWGANGAVKQLGNWSSANQNARAYETNSFPTTTGGDFTGTPAEASAMTYQAYVNGNFYRDVDIVYEPGVANFATGIGAIAFTPWSTFSRALGTTFSPKVAKNNTYRFTYRARVAWARV